VKEPRNNMNILYNMSRLLEKGKTKAAKIEDKWILSRFNSLIKEVTKQLEDLQPHLATKALQDFWLDDLSRGDIQFVRDRISEGDKEVKATLNEVYVGLIKLCSPIIPFMTEKILQELKKKLGLKEESVHLCEWPKPDSKKINGILEKRFESMLGVIEKGLAERDKAGIGLRWPLSKAVVYGSSLEGKGIVEIIKRQLNVKAVEFKKAKKEGWLEVKLDVKMTRELEEEGYSREVARKVQAERKRKGFKKGDIVELKLYVDSDLKDMLEKHIEFLKERTNSKKIEFIVGKMPKKASEFKIKGKRVASEFL
jgi:isoleucyl-tRNA synthetase